MLEAAYLDVLDVRLALAFPSSYEAVHRHLLGKSQDFLRSATLGTAL